LLPQRWSGPRLRQHILERRNGWREQILASQGYNPLLRQNKLSSCVVATLDVDIAWWLTWGLLAYDRIEAWAVVRGGREARLSKWEAGVVGPIWIDVLSARM